MTLKYINIFYSIVLHEISRNYFDNSIKSFSNLFLDKFWNISTRLFFPYGKAERVIAIFIHATGITDNSEINRYVSWWVPHHLPAVNKFPRTLIGFICSTLPCGLTDSDQCPLEAPPSHAAFVHRSRLIVY